VKKVGDAVYAGAVGALKLAMSLPHDCWNDLKATPAQPNYKTAAKAA
jgi:hypothetical protein